MSRYKGIKGLLFGPVKYETDRLLRKSKDNELREQELRDAVNMLQHERMVHLIVFSLTAFFWIACCIAMVLLPVVPVIILMVLVTFMLITYLHYYVFLENTTQKLECLLLHGRF